MSHALLVGRRAPIFSAKSVLGKAIVDFSLDDFLGKYIVLFFYPLDFTFVCPTELHAFQEAKQEFAKRGAELVACSVDSCYTHCAWLNTPKSHGGIEGIEYHLVADLNKEIAAKYQVLDAQAGVAYRGLFLIDPEGIIRHQLVNDLPIGRSVEETLRTLDAVIFHRTHGDVCPANWHQGQKSMKANAEGVVEFFSS